MSCLILGSQQELGIIITYFVSISHERSRRSKDAGVTQRQFNYKYFIDDGESNDIKSSFGSFVILGH